jgi:hypothetical protein
MIRAASRVNIRAASGVNIRAASGDVTKLPVRCRVIAP